MRSRYEPAGTNSLEGLTWADTYSVEDHESEVDVLRTIVRAFDRHATELGLAAAPDAVPHGDRRVADPARGGRRRGPSADRRGDREPAAGEHAAPDRRHGASTRVVAAPRRSPTPTSPADSPYNTYRVRGLPPTPISTVSAASLRAALHPANGAVPLLRAHRQERQACVRRPPTREHQANIADARAARGDPVITGATRLARSSARRCVTRDRRRSTTRRSRRLGLDWVYVALEVAPGAGADAVRARVHPRPRRPQRHDAAQDRRGPGLRRAHPGGRGTGVGEHGGAARRRHAARRLHRRRGVSPVARRRGARPRRSLGRGARRRRRGAWRSSPRSADAGRPGAGRRRDAAPRARPSPPRCRA